MAKTDWQMGDTVLPADMNQIGQEIHDNAAAAQAAQISANAAMPKAGGTMTGALNMGSNKISNLAAPTVAGDAARRAEIESPPYVTTTGTGTAYIAAFSPVFSALVPGTRITIKVNLANTGSATINVNGLGAKTILKSNGSALSAGNLKQNSVYSLVYDGTNFILQGEGGEYGNAGAAQVLTGYNIGTESGLVAGMMPNNGVLNYTPGQTVQSIPSGYTSGGSVAAVSFDAAKVLNDTTIAGKQGTMPSNGALNYTPGQASQTIPAGHTSGGSVASVVFDATKVLAGTTIAGKAGTMPNRAGDTAALASSVSGTMLKLRASNGYRDGVDDNVTITDPEFIAANIRKDINLFGLIGTLQEGMQYATGIFTMDSSNVVVSGLAFTPKIVIAKLISTNLSYNTFVYIDFSLLLENEEITSFYADHASNNTKGNISIQVNGFTALQETAVNVGNYKWWAFSG